MNLDLLTGTIEGAGDGDFLSERLAPDPATPVCAEAHSDEALSHDGAE